MSKKLEQTLARIKSDAPYATEVREIVTAIFGAVDAFADTAKAFAADKTYSADGAKGKALEALPATIGAVKSQTAALSRLAAGLADNERSLHAKLAPRPADVLRFAQLQEIRGYVAALPDASKLPFLMKHVDNPDVREAILGVPFPELAGLSGEKLEVFKTAVLERLFAAEVEQIAKARETLAVGEAGKAVALQALQSAAGIPAQEFAAMIEGKESKPSKPAGGKGKGMTQDEFNALPDSDRTLLTAARSARVDAFNRGEKWAREQYEADRAAFLFPPTDWERASA